MVFSSLIFLFLFLPMTLTCYYLSKERYKNIALLAFSLLFYAWGEPVYIYLMIFSIIIDYFLGLRVEKYTNLGKKKVAFRYVILSAMINLSLLCFFKYSDFLIENINLVFNLDIEMLNLALPVGISFYTFQTMSYTIDIYKQEAKAQKNILDFATYVTLFPQLVAGPIVRYETVANQINNRTHNSDKFSNGIMRFVMGLSKKVILSNQLALIADGVFNKDIISLSIGEAWIGIICYTLQIYFDFSGYSDMAIGLSKMFGFDFLENFNYPYISQSVSEFWRRWHISLGSWFRDYVYIPLGGSRVSRIKLYRNLLVVWFLTGIWHGASFNFIVWGLYFGFFIGIEKAFLEKYLYKLPRIFRHIYLLLVVIVGWVFFRANDLSYAVEFLLCMFGFLSNPIYNNSLFIYINDYWYIIISSIILSMPVLGYIKPRLLRLDENILTNKNIYVVKGILITICMMVVIIMLNSNTYNPFLYFRF